MSCDLDLGLPGSTRKFRSTYMSKLYFVVLIVAASAVAAVAQTKADVLPLPIESPRSLAPYPSPERLTVREKATLALKGTFGLPAIGEPSAFGWYRSVARPPGGMARRDGRLWHAIRLQDGPLAVCNSIRFGEPMSPSRSIPGMIDAIAPGFGPVLFMRWRRVLVSRADSGGEMPAISNFTSVFGRR